MFIYLVFVLGGPLYKFVNDVDLPFFRINKLKRKAKKKKIFCEMDIYAMVR